MWTVSDIEKLQSDNKHLYASLSVEEHERRRLEGEVEKLKAQLEEEKLYYSDLMALYKGVLRDAKRYKILRDNGLVIKLINEDGEVEKMEGYRAEKLLDEKIAEEHVVR